MCVVFLAWRVHPAYPLVLVGNRDEFHARPTAPAAPWGDAPSVFAGRDLKKGGTWLGVTRAGRWAVVTNYRDPALFAFEGLSRGALVADFLRADAPPGPWLEALAPRAEAYGGFNLLLGDRDEAWSFGDRGGPPQRLGEGLYGLSNALLDTPWPKVEAGKARLAAHLNARGALDLAPLADLLSDGAPFPDDALPDTGVPRDFERQLSPLFIDIPERGYGTRASTAVTVDEAGELRFFERSWRPGREVTGEVEAAWRLPDGAGLTH